MTAFQSGLHSENLMGAPVFINRPRFQVVLLACFTAPSNTQSPRAKLSSPGFGTHQYIYHCMHGSAMQVVIGHIAFKGEMANFDLSYLRHR
jgi:hypothetical protein